MTVPGAVDDVAGAATAETVTETPAAAAPLRILLVEDNEDDVVLVRRMLYKAFPGGGVRLQHAPSVEAALEQLSAATFDVLVCDHRLGNRTGLELLREARERGDSTAVIFLTGHGDEAIAVQAMKDGAYDYLSKAKLTQEHLAQAIRYTMTLHRQQQVLREAQSEVQRREERFRALVENSFDATVLLDENAAILWASNSNFRVLGYTGDSRRGQNALAETHPEDLPAAEVALREALRRPGEPIQVCCRLRHADGSWRSIEGIATNRLHEPTVASIVFNFRDVTEKKLAEEALRRSEHQYQMLFEMANDAILLYEPDSGRILEANAKAAAMYGGTRSQIVGQNMAQFAGDGQPVGAWDPRTGRDFETVHRRLDGSTVAVQVSASLVDYQGRPAVMGIHRDISERKRAEQEVRRLNRALLALSKCTQAVAQAGDEAELLQQVCRILVQIGGYLVSWVGYAEPNERKTVQPVAQFGDNEGYLATFQVSWGDDELSRGPAGSAIRTGKASVVRNVLNDPAYRPWAGVVHQRGVASVLALPLKEDDRTFGSLNIYSAVEDAFDTQEQEMLGELAGNLAFGIVAARTRSERQRAVEGLRRALQWQQAVFEGSLDAVFITSTSGEIVDANRAACQLTGYGEEELFKLALPNLYVGERSGSCDLQAARLLGGRALCETGLRTRNGKEVSVELSSSSILVGGAAFIHTVARDITEAKAAKDKLRKLSSAVEQSADMVIITDRDGIIEYVNPAFEAATGYSKPEVIGNALRLLKCGTEEDLSYQQIWATVLAGNVYRGVTQNRKKNGELYWSEKTITPVRGPDGQITHLTCNDRDITAQKRAEEALRASEERYRELFEQNLAGVFRASLQGEVLECNQALVKMLGYEGREELRHPGIVDQIITGERRREWTERLLRGERLVNLEMTVHKKDGSSILLLNNLNLLRDEHGRPAFVDGTVMDITELRKLQEQLLQAQKMDAIGQLAGGVAHDFNNLLMVISSYAELMLDRLGAENGLRRHAEQIQKAARRAADLTRQLMAFSRKQVQALQLLDLNTVLAELVRMLPRLIGEDIQVAFHPGEHLPPIQADPVQIEQVVMNLATNARDAMPQGGRLTLETANVHLDPEYARRHVEVPPGDYVMLAVSDSGVGIAPEVMPHIFEPFFTTKAKGKGTGLGLASVYGIIKQSGGYVWVYSEPAQGTTFKIYLPPASRADAGAKRAERGEPRLNGAETLLLVEDEEAVRESAREYLAKCGYKVLTAGDGQEGIAAAESYQGSIHLLITDVVMPRISGSELAERITAARPRMKVLYISGYTENTVLQHGVRELGAQFLQKPFTLKGLAQKIRQLLDDGDDAGEAAPDSQGPK